MQKRKIFIGLGIAIVILLVIALILWLKPNQSTNDSAQIKNADATISASSVIDSPNAANTSPFASTSQQDIQINCQLKVDSSNHLIVNEGTKNCFEFFITQYGEKTLDQIKADFLRYCEATYKDPLKSQVIDLWTRYLQYREKLGDIQEPSADKEDPKYYKAVFAEMKNLRKKFFSNYEIDGLFGPEDVYNDYTISRMEVMNDKSLTAEQKAKKLKALFDDLPEDWKENLQQISQLDDLRKLTAEIKARGGSADELRQMRTNLVGPAATERLEKLDVQRSQWKGRVSDYLAQRDTIMKSNMSDSAKQTAIENMRKQNFSNAQEQLRIQTFESIHDHGGQLPFGD
ncbi:lipase secretion chaperone [Acinetobacter sp. 194]|uniref:lipase secretion chaperone n=1 Tax=Acinetobacter shaoyimingii TaxID=2715164 RepID=UPI00140B8BAE|nr:lipase secretion chaperone [Acinetobacter shaoyimingii]NHB58061.1 lipase secretion chaperone [Acinetobacter shaoyimingii]